jgi:pilus assembly protein CpaC
MKIKNLIKAGALGVAVLTATAPQTFAQNVLNVMRGAASNSISVSVNRAVVMESDRVFAEVSVANPGIADVAALSDRNLYVLGKVPGRTTLTLLGPNGGLITNVDIRVSPDVAEFKERLKEILPRERIEVRTANDGIVLSGQVSGAQQLARAVELAERYAPERVTNLMSVGGTQQVMLKVRFAEMQRSVAKRLATSVGTANSGNRGVALVGNGAWALPSAGGGRNLGTLADATAGGDVTIPNDPAGLGLFTIGLGGFEVGLFIEALESKGMVRTLAEPNIVAVSGQDAEFLAGGEYPIPVVEDGSVKVEYRPFGVELLFKPTVLTNDVINLELGASVSAIDPTVAVTTNGITVNGFSVRKAVTTVEMRDGESFAIAGLLQDDFSDLKGQVPWLGDVPILGSLFRSTEFERRQSELIIIVTPHLVTPTVGEALALPTDRMRIPTERELFVHGLVEGRQGSVGQVAQQDLQGSIGYVVE